MTYWRCRMDVNPGTNWRPCVYFAISAKCANDDNTAIFFENLSGHESTFGYAKKISAIKYAWKLLTLPVTNHRDFVHYKESVVIE